MISARLHPLNRGTVPGIVRRGTAGNEHLLYEKVCVFFSADDTKTMVSDSRTACPIDAMALGWVLKHWSSAPIRFVNIAVARHGSKQSTGQHASN